MKINFKRYWLIVFVLRFRTICVVEVINVDNVLIIILILNTQEYKTFVHILRLSSQDGTPRSCWVDNLVPAPTSNAVHKLKLQQDKTLQCSVVCVGLSNKAAARLTMSIPRLK